MNSENENKKPSYFRDGSEPKSKYIRSKDEKRESRYLRSKDDSEEEELQKGEYRKNVITPKRAKEIILEEEMQNEQETFDVEETEPVEIPEENVETKGNAEELFNIDNTDKEEDKKNEEQRARKGNVENSLKLVQNQALIRMVVCVAFLTAIAVILQLFSFHIPYTPEILTVDFSTLPELIGSIAYGPIIGVIICIVKNVIHMMIRNTSAVSDFSNMLLNSTFIFIAGMLYSRSMFLGDKNVVQPEDYKRKDYRRRRIFKSAFFGAIISAVPQFFITSYISYPLLEKLYYNRGLTVEVLLEDYQVCYERVLRHLPQAISSLMPEMTNMARGIAFINLPVTFAKLFVVTVITAIIYKWISPFLHYRPKDK